MGEGTRGEERSKKPEARNQKLETRNKVQEGGIREVRTAMILSLVVVGAQLPKPGRLPHAMVPDRPGKYHLHRRTTGFHQLFNTTPVLRRSQRSADQKSRRVMIGIPNIVFGKNSKVKTTTQN